MKRLLESDRIKLALLVLAAGIFLINSRALWFSDEIRYADAYSNLVNYKKWIVLFLNGEPYPDKPPVYFWVVYAVQSISRLSIPSSMFLTSVLSGVFYILCHYSFAMKLTNDKQISYISGLVLLTNFYFLGLVSYIRMDLLFASFIILAFLYIAKYLTDERAVHVYAAFGFSAVAVLIKGPLGAVFPLVFLLTAGLIMKKYRRVFSIHVFLAIVLAAVPSILWLYSISLIEGREFMEDLLENQVLKRASKTWHHDQPFYYYLYTLPLAWFPWLLAVLVSIRKAGRATIDLFTGSTGGMFIAAIFFSGFVTLSALSGKIAIYTLPLFSPIAVYFAYVYLHTDKSRFWLSISVFFVAAGVFAFSLNRLHIFRLPLDNIWTGWAALAAAFIIFGFRKHKHALTVATITVIIFFNIVGLTMIKSGDNLFSPKNLATKMRSYVDKGYRPVAYRAYSGLYSYYAGVVINEVDDKDTLRMELAPGKKVVLGIAEKYWYGILDNPEKRFKIVDTQWIMGRNYLLMISIPPQNNAR